jgi:hypothetical protein
LNTQHSCTYRETPSSYTSSSAIIETVSNIKHYQHHQHHDQHDQHQHHHQHHHQSIINHHHRYIQFVVFSIGPLGGGPTDQEREHPAFEHSTTHNHP